jgi:hypothetical protein
VLLALFSYLLYNVLFSALFLQRDVLFPFCSPSALQLLSSCSPSALPYVCAVSAKAR